jgi:hypothetical protein
VLPMPLLFDEEIGPLVCEVPVLYFMPSVFRWGWKSLCGGIGSRVEWMQRSAGGPQDDVCKWHLSGVACEKS